MSEPTTAVQERVITIGPDRITIREHEVIIEAKHKMPDWQVRDLNPPPVYFEDNKYYLVQVSKANPPYASRYLLHPWPQDLSSNNKGFYTYDAEAVSARDGALRSNNVDDLVHAFMLPFYPLLGMLWSGVQRRLTRFGFVPHTISGVSIFLTFCLLFGQGIFATITINGSLRSGKMIIGGYLRAMTSQDALHLGPISIPLALLDCLLAIALFLDLLVRYSHYLRDHDWAGGFLEWMFRKGGSKPEAPEPEEVSVPLLSSVAAQVAAEPQEPIKLS